MKKQLLLALFIFISLQFSGYSQCDGASQCSYTFQMGDAYGDGWNGSTMSVIQNGNVVAVLNGPEIGSTVLSQTVSLCDGAPFILFWNDGGEYPEEILISVVNSFGQTLYIKDGSVDPNNALFMGMVNCLTPACQEPNNLFAYGITSSSSDLQWQQTGDAAQWEVFIAPAGSPAPTQSTAGIPTSTNSYHATGLLPGTGYDFYVRSICSATSASNWSYGYTFLPQCYTPNFPNVTQTSTGTPVLNWNEVGNATSWEILVLPADAPEPTAASIGIVTTENPYVTANLVVGTNYKFYVRAICGASDFSVWSGAEYFTASQVLPPLVTYTSEYSPAQLVESVLVNNPCISISNVTSSTGTDFASSNGIGFFTNTNPTFPIASGLVLSTGDVSHIPGPNDDVLSDGEQDIWPGDPELETIVFNATGNEMNSHNATTLEFDFTSLNEFMSFNFLFASDEYGFYQCEYADAFAFLLTDLTTGITTNLAVVPGTATPVSVVTIRDNANNIACSSENPGFFDAYFEGDNMYESATDFNGQTALMTASSTIIPNNPYHIKLVVADRGDAAYDSAVFIEAGSFASGPPSCSDKIQLVSFIDSNENGVKDSGEVNFTYGSFTAQQNNAGDTTSISSPLGTYIIYDPNPANTYDFNFAVNPEFSGYYAAAATNFDDINIPAGSGTQVLYFPVVLTSGYNDVTVSVIPVTPPVAGSVYTNKIVYKNLGVAPASGTLSYSNHPTVSISAVSQTGTVSNSGGFTYAFSNLQPYETRTITVTSSVPEIPTVNIGDLVTDSASISAPSNDINLANNGTSSTQTLVASYDPNDKMESHGGKIQFNQFSQNDYLYYTIRFQNTGTANALSVRLEDLLDTQIDPESIRMVSASHNYVMQRIANKVIWNFDYIQLPPALQSEALSRGYVTFQVTLKPGFTISSMIPNKADIYFDSNPAIITNTFNTKFVTLLANAQFDSGNLLMFPNPASSFVQISLQNTNETLDNVFIYDVVGKAIKMVKGIAAAQTAIDVSELSTGVYVVEINTENKARQIRKLVIQ